MEFCGHREFLTRGNGVCCGRTNAQCGLYSAPAAIQFFRICFSAADNLFFVLGGGISLSSSVEKIRFTNSLSLGFPGTMAVAPDFAGRVATSRTSRRNFDLRAPSSGPWHLKQLRDRIGLTSAVKSGCETAAPNAN